jgi:hypothetical protein
VRHGEAGSVNASAMEMPPRKPAQVKPPKEKIDAFQKYAVESTVFGIGGKSRMILYSHFFHLKKKYGSTAAIAITTKAIG